MSSFDNSCAVKELFIISVGQLAIKGKNNAMECIHLQEDNNGVRLLSKKPFVNLKHVVGICNASSV